MNAGARLSEWLLAAAPTEAWNASELTLLTQLPGWLLTVTALALGAVFVLSAAATRGAPRRVRVGLGLLRLLLVLGVFAVMLEPGLRLMQKSREKNRVVLAVDLSGSMAHDDGTGKSRTSRALQAAEQLAARLTEDEDSPFIVEWRGFADGPVALDAERRANLLANVDTPVGTATDLRSAIAGLERAGGETPLGGVVIFSDGADTTGELAGLKGASPEAWADLDAPVHGVFVASEEQFKDIALEAVIADEFAFVRNALRFQVRVRHSGFEDLEVQFAVKEDGRPLLIKSGKLDGPGETLVEFEIEPKAAGEHIFSVSVPVHPDEALKENNRIDFALRVIRDRIRVLQVAGRPSWDERFVRRLLKENPSVDLISFFILRSPTDNAHADSSELSLIPFPTRELFTEELHTFDVVILQDFNYRPYQMGTYLKNIRDFVHDSGGSLMMIGGALSFSEGEYDGTPIAEVLPVKLFPGHGHLSEETFRPILTEAGRTHPVTDLGDLAGTGSPFAELPELEGVNLVAGLTDGSEALLAHPFLNTGGEPHPVVAVREVGEGRSMAILTDSTWVWSLPHVGAGGRGDVHRRFFANALRWLIRDPELSRAKVEADRASYEPGDEVTAQIRTFDAKYRPLGGCDVELTVTALEGGQTGEPLVFETVEATTGPSGGVHLSFTPEEPGPYRMRVVARHGGRSIGSDVDAFVVRGARAETLFAEPRRAPLTALADATGGQVVAPRDVDALQFVDQGVERVLRQKTEPLWPSGLTAALLTLLAGLEWWWRRRRGFA